MVHNLKYRNVRASAPDLGRLMADYLWSEPVPGGVLVPIPLHFRRERSRGFNQSALLAREVGRLTGIPVAEDILRRVPAFGGEFRLVLDRESSELDRLTVQVEIEEETYGRLSMDSEEMGGERESVAAALRRALGVGVIVELVPEGSFERTQFKSRRVIDNRGIWRVGG